MKRRDPVIISAQDYYGISHNFLEKKNEYELFYNLSDHLRDLSKGFVYKLKCQPGLVLTITRQFPSTAISISHNKEPNSVRRFRLFFTLGDGSSIRSHSQRQETTFCSNQGYLIYERSKSCLIHCPAIPICAIGLSIEPWLIKRFFQGSAGEFDRKIKEMLDLKKQDEVFRYPVFMNSSIDACLHEILGCTYTDARRHLFLGSKALELMRFTFDQLNPEKGQVTACFNLMTDPPNFVHKARDIIVSDIKNPPSLTELSKMVGVNRTTLTQCFTKVYGVTIFNFLRNFRLEESKRLLQAGNRSVTQVAFEVGYAQQRTFSKEFKKYFGDKPSDYLR